MSTAGCFALFGARLLIASLFCFSAWSKLWGEEFGHRTTVGIHLPQRCFLMAAAGFCEILGALMLVSGIGARAAAVTLGLLALASTAAFLRFWTVSGPRHRFDVANIFFGNLALIASLVLLAVYGPGPFALMPST